MTSQQTIPMPTVGLSALTQRERVVMGAVSYTHLTLPTILLV